MIVHCPKQTRGARRAPQQVVSLVRQQLVRCNECLFGGLCALNRVISVVNMQCEIVLKRMVFDNIPPHPNWWVARMSKPPLVNISCVPSVHPAILLASDCV